MVLVLTLPPTIIVGGSLSETHWSMIEACPSIGGGVEGGPIATAVCIGQRDGFAYLLTAAHGVPQGEAKSYKFYTRQTYPKPSQTFARGEVVLRITDPDLALVKLPIGNGVVSTIPLAPPGERPKRFPFTTTALGCPNGKSPQIRSEKVIAKKLVRRPDEGVAFYWQVATPPVGGMSGGPLLNSDSKVIGICSATQGGVGYFTHADEILYALQQNGYGWLFAHPKE